MFYPSKNCKPQDFFCVPIDCVPNSVLEQLNGFADVITDNTTVIYESLKNTVVVLGIYNIDRTNIVESKHYELLRNNTLIQGEKDLTDDLKNTKCVHISSWYFDEVLRDKETLSRILRNITSVYAIPKTKQLLWCDGLSELYFYPINLEGINMVMPSPIEYFANKMLNE